MLTFFNRIRKGLLDTSQARKYIVHVIGEILLVMIGILLALQVNNWNENKKRKIEIETYYGSIRNLEDVIMELEHYIELNIKHSKTVRNCF